MPRTGQRMDTCAHEVCVQLQEVHDLNLCWRLNLLLVSLCKMAFLQVLSSKTEPNLPAKNGLQATVPATRYMQYSSEATLGWSLMVSSQGIRWDCWSQKSSARNMSHVVLKAEVLREGQDSSRDHSDRWKITTWHFQEIPKVKRQVICFKGLNHQVSVQQGENSELWHRLQPVQSCPVWSCGRRLNDMALHALNK